LACGATTGLAAAIWKAEVEAGASVAVFGAGMVGLGALLGAKMQGAERLIAVDLSAERLELAKKFGATDTIVAGDGGEVEKILEMTGGFGADYTFEATGLVSVMGQAVEAARMGWGLCTVLGVAGKGEKMEIVPRMLITGRRVQGGSFGGARGRTHVPQLVDLYAEGKLDLDGFVSHRITLDQVNEGFELMEKQDGIRSVIRFD
jgi:S-(hydroxymethyl)glutathione dehydrogenase/alcohol dehydrogenase